MEFRAIMPMLKVTDFERSVHFYQNVLGSAVTWRAKDDGVLYIEMGSGVSEYWDRIGTKAPVAWPLAQMEYGTLEFGIRDPDGYALAFSQQRAG